MREITEQEYHAFKETYKFLCSLIDTRKTPRLPKYIRLNAKKCLKHYPIDKPLRDVLETVEFFNPR